MRQSFIPWLVIPVWLFTVVYFGYGFYRQLYFGQQFGEQPMGNSELLWTGILTIVFTGVLFLVLMSIVLVTEIWTDGIRYRFKPFMWKLKHIRLDEIESASVMKYNPLFEFGGWGIKPRLLSRKTAYNISGNIGLRIMRKNGSQVMIGTHRKEELQRAVDKMRMPALEKYPI